jgi:uncharacterized protein YjiS (DUF1127 family)
MHQAHGGHRPPGLAGLFALSILQCNKKRKRSKPKAEMMEADMTALIDQPGHALRDGTTNWQTRLFANLRGAWARHGEAALRRELHSLSDRELADIGISRLSIAEIARTAAEVK